MDTYLERCSNFTLYWCSCCIIRYLYWRCIWSRFWFLWSRVDDVMQRILEIIASIPNLIVVILFVLIFEPSIWTIILAMSITGWLGMSRVVRGEF